MLALGGVGCIQNEEVDGRTSWIPKEGESGDAQPSEEAGGSGGNEAGDGDDEGGTDEQEGASPGGGGNQDERALKLEGEAIFTETCSASGCHANGQNLSDASSLTPGSIETAFDEQPLMNSFKDKYDKDQLEALAAYMVDL